MNILATQRMESYFVQNQKMLVLSNDHGTIELPIEGQHVVVPYPWVRRAMELGWALPSTTNWPPRPGDMSPPEALKPGDRVQLPDGSEIEIRAPFNQVVEFPERLIATLQKLGWVSLAQFA